MQGVIVKEKSAGLQKKPLIIVVGTVVSKKATKRNLLKRRVRTIMKPYLISNKLNFTIILKKEALRMSFNDLKKTITDQI